MSRPLYVGRGGPRVKGYKTCTYNGSTYHSRKERDYAMRLDMLMKSGHSHKGTMILSWERQVKVSLDVGGVHICNYYVDFRVEYSDGREEYHEVKGFETDLWRIKRRLFEALFPERVLVVIR